MGIEILEKYVSGRNGKMIDDHTRKEIDTIAIVEFEDLDKYAVLYNDDSLSTLYAFYTPDIIGDKLIITRELLGIMSKSETKDIMEDIEEYNTWIIEGKRIKRLYFPDGSVIDF